MSTINATYNDDYNNKALKYLKKAVSKLKTLKLPSSTSPPSHKSGCYAICIDNLGPIQIPTFYISQSHTTSGKIEVLLYCSIFHSISLSFIGRTWTSNVFPTNRNNQAVPIQKYWIYLKSQPSENKWVIIELVAQIRNEGVIISKISLGWTVIKLFTNIRALIDVHPDENNNDPLQRESKLKQQFLFNGSPTYLLINSDITSIPETSIKCSYKLFTFKKLHKLSHLLNAETIIGPNNIIPGLGQTIKLPSNPYDKSWKILFDIKPNDFIVSSPFLTLPEGFDNDILTKLTKIRKNGWCGTNETTAKIIERELNISFYNGRNIITPPTVIQLQCFQNNILSWNGDIKIRVNANLQHNCWLLVSLNYRIEWKDDPSSAQSPSYHHSICVGRDLINMTSEQLILNGTQPTKLTLSPNYSWIDDNPIFNNNFDIIPDEKKPEHPQFISAAFIIKFADSKVNMNNIPKPKPQRITTSFGVNTNIPAMESEPSSTKSMRFSQQQQQPTLSTIHHVSSFGLSAGGTRPQSAQSAQITQNPLSIRSSGSMAKPLQNGDMLQTPQGFINTPQGMVAMTWDDIRKQSLTMIPSNVLQNKLDSNSKLGILQESFAMNTWQKLQGQSYPKAKILKTTQSMRSLRSGYAGFDFSPFDMIPNRKLIDIPRELKISHKRLFIINCKAFSIKAKELLINPIQSIVIELLFMGEKVTSDPILVNADMTINNLRESLMTEDKYQSLPFTQEYQFEFHILPNQIRQFISFMNERYAIFTVYNANTMFQIGSARVCLRDFLLQDTTIENHVKDVIEVNVTCTRITTKPLSMIETQPNISFNTLSNVNGKLCLEINHQAMDLSDTAKLQYAGWSEYLITNTCDQSGDLCVRNLKLIGSNNTRIKPEKLYKNPHIKPKLQKLPNNHSDNPYERVSYPTTTIKTKWKIPIDAIHEISNHPDLSKTEPFDNDENDWIHDEEWKVRTGNIETMNDYRQRKKQEMLNKLSQPDQFTIQPSFGQVIFFEIEFTNPWNQRKKFRININDPLNISHSKNKDLEEELMLVTNVKEISYLKEKFNVNTTMKRHLFEKENVNEIYLNPSETVYIPFKFQSFAVGTKHDKNALYPRFEANNDDEKMESEEKGINPIQRRVINVSFHNIDDNENFHSDENMEQNKESVVEFNVSVEPMKFITDRVFNIYAFQNSKFVGNLPLPTIRNIHTTQDEHILSVRCSSNQTAFEFDKNNENITFRCDVRQYPKQNIFYFIVYNDRYCIDINEIWEVKIHSYFNENCHGMLGGLIKNDIHLPSILDNIGTEQISFYCDQQNGMELELKQKDNKNVLNVQYAPPEIGKKLMRIHCIDNAKDIVIYSCMMVMHVEMPKINNSFVIHIEGGSPENKEIITRKLPYNNGYNQDRNYELISNDPSIIRITNPCLEIPSESTMEFILEVMPKNIIGHSKEVLLFVTECGNLEQCLRIEVKKGKVTNL